MAGSVAFGLGVLAFVVFWVPELVEGAVVLLVLAGAGVGSAFVWAGGVSTLAGPSRASGTTDVASGTTGVDSGSRSLCELSKFVEFFAEIVAGLHGVRHAGLLAVECRNHDDAT